MLSADSFESKASTPINPGDDDRHYENFVVEFNSVTLASDITPDSDQMLLKQAFRSAVVTNKATAKAWLRTRTIGNETNQSTKSISAQKLPGAVSQD